MTEKSGFNFWQRRKYFSPA